jgi:hypothetical protein
MITHEKTMMLKMMMIIKMMMIERSVLLIDIVMIDIVNLNPDPCMEISSCCVVEVKKGNACMAKWKMAT